jgi:hypothetical protein
MVLGIGFPRCIISQVLNIFTEMTTLRNTDAPLISAQCCHNKYVASRQARHEISRGFPFFGVKLKPKIIFLVNFTLVFKIAISWK